MKINRSELVGAADSILMTPGDMVRELRELKGWSQLDLAAETGISQTNISAIENGRVELGKARAIIFAQALSVHPAAIMFADYNVAA